MACVLEFRFSADARLERRTDSEPVITPSPLAPKRGVSRRETSALSEGHDKGEAGFLSRRPHRQRPLVSLCDLRRDMQPEAKALPAGTNLAAEEWLKQLRHCSFRYWLPTICDRQFEQPILRHGADAHGLVGRTVAECVSDEIRNQLSNSDPIAIHGNVD